MTHNCRGHDHVKATWLGAGALCPPNVALLVVDVVHVTDANLAIEWFTVRVVYSQRHGCQSRTAQRRALPINEVILHRSNVIDIGTLLTLQSSLPSTLLLTLLMEWWGTLSYLFEFLLQDLYVCGPLAHHRHMHVPRINWQHGLLNVTSCTRRIGVLARRFLKVHS